VHSKADDTQTRKLTDFSLMNFGGRYKSAADTNRPIS